MKYLVLGSNGMAGHMISVYLTERGHQVKGFARQKSTWYENYIGDARCMEDIQKALAEDTYDYVINCIGVLNQYVDAHLADGLYLNSVLPHQLAEMVKNTSAKFIHISTDCVFSGAKGGYTEADIPDATSYYGRSKALGEVCDGKNLTIRTSIVGPEIKKDGIGLLHWFLNQTGEVSGYDRVVWSGVTTLQLAKVIEQDIEQKQTGLYHLVNNQVISKYELLQLFNKYIRKNPIAIRKEVGVQSDKSLKNTLITPQFYVPSYEQMVKELAEWMQAHPELYRQYAGV